MVDTEKVKAITDYPVPNTIKKLRKFLGMSGWYRRFVEDYATVTFPLTELLSKKKFFVWNSKAQEAFEKVKGLLSSAPFLIHPNYVKKFILQCDASKVYVGAVLAQVDEDGADRPIAFMSQKLNRAQRNYTHGALESV